MALSNYQWGTTRSFVREKFACRIVPHTCDEIVDDLMLFHVDGDATQATTLLSDLKKDFVGKHINQWSRNMTPTPFDAMRAAREEIQGLTEIRLQLVAQKRRAEDKITIAENELTTATKLLGFCDAELERKRQRLMELSK